MSRTQFPGKPFPQGATWDGVGVNFAVYSECATEVELCLFNEGENEPSETYRIREVTGKVWHIYLAGIKPGQFYGYRVNGPYEPEKGLRFNSHKLLIDPYARAIAGTVDWDAPIFGYKTGDEAQDLSFDDRDSSPGVPKSVVTSSHFDWDNDHSPQIQLHDSVIYEVNVKGFTAACPLVPQDLRGTYAGIGYPSTVEYLKNLGITAVELMPVHAFVDEHALLERGLRNYWGYNTINYFSPEARYSSSKGPGDQVAEFKAMVKSLHRAGIEVILDVVYNHTAEGNQMGPTLSFRGIDNVTYYRLSGEAPRYYMDYTGTGNTLNVRHPQVLKLIMDSLRYWVLDMHVDGFRFDLAVSLARELHEVNRLSAFFDIINQDPVISQVKLIAEPWDVGEGGYQVGKFPYLWAEWNGKYRDTVRKYWKGESGQLADLGYRLTGSSDLYQYDGRHPTASVNFVTAHDGFTLRDLVSYDHKHNEANGDNNQDGANDNNSCNYGVEGPTDDPAIEDIRRRQMRNFMASLLLSQGVPMICGGDEIERTQRGNNNAYCQDSEISWYDWNLNDKQKAFRDFTSWLVHFRREHPNLHRRKFFQDRPINPAATPGVDIEGGHVRDITWIRADGNEMTEDEWKAAWIQSLGMQLSGDTLDDVNGVGEAIRDDTFLFLFNAHHDSIQFHLPACRAGRYWELCFDTRAETPANGVTMECRAVYELIGRSVAVFKESKQKAPDGGR